MSSLVLVTYIPEESLDLVKEKLFASGCGNIDSYSHCCWQVKGVGQFKPLEGSNPTIGQKGLLESVVEYRVEFILHENDYESVKQTLLQSHPYETPAYHFYEVKL